MNDGLEAVFKQPPYRASFTANSMEAILNHKSLSSWAKKFFDNIIIGRLHMNERHVKSNKN